MPFVFLLMHLWHSQVQKCHLIYLFKFVKVYLGCWQKYQTRSLNCLCFSLWVQICGPLTNNKYIFNDWLYSALPTLPSLSRNTKFLSHYFGEWIPLFGPTHPSLMTPRCVSSVVFQIRLYHIIWLSAIMQILSNEMAEDDLAVLVSAGSGEKWNI